MNNNEINTNNVVSANNVTEANTTSTINTSNIGNGSNMNNQKPKNNKTVVICMAIIIIILLGIIGFLIFNSIGDKMKDNNENGSNVSDNGSSANNQNEENKDDNSKIKENENTYNYNSDVSFTYENVLYFIDNNVEYYKVNLSTNLKNKITKEEFYDTYFDYKEIKINSIDDSEQSKEIKEKYELIRTIYNECVDASCEVTKLLNYINSSNFDEEYYVNSSVMVESLEESGYYMTIYNIKYDDFKNNALTIMSEDLFNKLFTKDVYDSNENGDLISRELGSGNSRNIQYLKITGSNGTYTAYEVYDEAYSSYGIFSYSTSFTTKNVNGNIVIDYIDKATELD